MKYAIVQVSKYYVCITPAESGKPFVSSGNDRNSKKPDYEVTFREPIIHILPEGLRGQAWNFPRELATEIRMAMRNRQIDIKDVILCAEGDQVISQEYQHTPAKEKFVKIFAENEARALVNDDISAYSLINCEYGSGYQKAEDDTQQVGANVYIMPKGYIEELKMAFKEQSLNIYKLIPPTVSMIKMAQTGIYSFDKSVALISLDYCSARLLVMQKGVPVYVHSFPLPMGDIANVFANDQNCSLEEAFEVIRKYGVGISEKCNSVQAGREMRHIFENFSNEVVRNLRMVLLSCRIELDQIYASDFVAYIPGILKHLRMLNVTADEINLISDAFTSLTNVPIITKEADEAGYKTACFYTYSYLVNSGSQNENNLAVFSGGGAAKSIDVSAINAGIVNMLVIGVVIVAVGIMAFIGIKSYALQVRAQNDEAKLNDPKYDEIKGLLATQEDLTIKMASVDQDKAALPNPNADVNEMLTEVFEQITREVDFVNTYNVKSDDNSIALDFIVKDLEAYNKLDAAVKENNFFAIRVPFSSQNNVKDNNWTATVTLNAVGYPDGTEEVDEDGKHVNISQGTNFDEMIESAKE
ncbi:MAG: hypothetical protein K2M82_07125 [Lachnospiraceae bacterium]|nr:hypothetical protein [Lachnospiraceae bacterium]